MTSTAVNLTYSIGPKGGFSLNEASKQSYASQPTNFWNLETSMSRMVSPAKLSVVFSRSASASRIGLKAGQPLKMIFKYTTDPSKVVANEDFNI